MRFSERHGIVNAKDTIQIDSIDNDLRNGLWNAVQMYYLDKVESKQLNQSRYHLLFRNIWHTFFKLPLDTMDNWGLLKNSGNLFYINISH